MHTPVLLQEVVEYLQPGPGKKFIDATVGAGGHSKMLLEAGADVLGIDRDPKASAELSSEFKIQNSKIKIIQGNFRDLKEIAEREGFIGINGVLFDLGMSSAQLDDPARGFAFQKDGPLDMRYDPSEGKTAGELVNFYPENELVKIFLDFGEERRFGKKVARAILNARKSRTIQTTTELFELVKTALPGQYRHWAGDVARRVFQALRIAINGELRNLELALPQASDILKLHGRIAVISFHSLEDRIVKRFFVRESKNCVCPPEFPVCRCTAKAKLRILTKKPIRPQETEINTNSRAKSAKLRVAEKIWDDFSP